MKEKINITDKPSDTSSASVDLFNSEYYKFNKWLLSIFGQWPYQSSRERKIRAASILLYTFTVAVPQVGPMHDFHSNVYNF